MSHLESQLAKVFYHFNMSNNNIRCIACIHKVIEKKSSLSVFKMDILMGDFAFLLLFSIFIIGGVRLTF